MNRESLLCEAIRAIERIACDCVPHPPISLHWTIGPVREQELPPWPGVTTMLVLTDTQQCDLSIQPVDKKGQPAQIDGVPVWSSSDASVVAVNASSDGLSATIVAGNIGTAQVNVTVDADLGSGVTDVVGVLDVQVTAGAAVSVTINAGSPTEQP